MAIDHEPVLAKVEAATESVRPLTKTTAIRALRWERISVYVFCALTDALLYWVSLNVATLLRLHSLIYVNLWVLQRDRIICAAIIVCFAALLGAYRQTRLSNRFDSAYYVWLALFWGCLTQLVLILVVGDKQRAISTREILAGAFLAALLIGAFRFKAATLLSRLSSMKRSFHVLGDPDTGTHIVEEIRNNEDTKAGAYYCSAELLNRIARHTQKGKRIIHPREAILVLPGDSRERLLALLDKAIEVYDHLYFYPTLEDSFLFPLSRFSSVAGVPLVEFVPKGPASPYLLFKRIFDFSVALIGLILAFPIGLAAALAIKLTSPGPVFYSQERMGKGGKTFMLYKFRTMIPNAEAATGPVWAKTNDPRVTPVGKFLRKHRIDELPQLFNVLKGDMSLIGPRPERPHFHNEFRKRWPLFDKRLLVRPGVTSLSHVLSSYDSDPDDRLRYDLLYISNLSFITDLKIFLATVRVVLGAKGAQ